MFESFKVASLGGTDGSMSRLVYNSLTLCTLSMAMQPCSLRTHPNWPLLQRGGINYTALLQNRPSPCDAPRKISGSFNRSDLITCKNITLAITV